VRSRIWRADPPSCLVFAPVAAFWLVLVVLGWQRRIAAAACVLLPVVAVAVLWSMRSSRLAGHPVIMSIQGKANSGSPIILSRPGSTTTTASCERELSGTSPQERVEHARQMGLEARRFIRENPAAH